MTTMHNLPKMVWPAVGNKIGAGAAKTYVIDKAAGAVISKGADLLTGTGKAVVRTLGEFASKNAALSTRSKMKRPVSGVVAWELPE